MVNYEEKLNEMEFNAKEWTDKLNQFNREHNMDESLKAAAHIDEILKEYAKTKREEVFINCRSSEDPMKTACYMLKYTVLKLKTERVEGQQYPNYSIDYSDKLIDLLGLHRFCNPNGIGDDPTWMYKIEKFGLLMAVKVADDIGDDPKMVSDSYYVKYSASREVDLGKNPLSNTQMLKTVQSLVTAMLGDGYKANSHDVKFIQHAFTKESNKVFGIDAAPYRKLVNLMAKVCHRILTGRKYVLGYKVAKP